MGAGYTRQSAAEIQTGEIVEASPLNAEFNQLQNAFDGTTGHTHDGTVGEGPKINLTTSVSGVLPVANGGTAGVNKLNATTAPTVTDDSNDGYSVGSLWIDVTNDIVYICVDSTVGAAVWERHQLYDAGLQSISGLTTAADRMIYTTGSDTYAVTPLTSFARTVLDDADAATVRTTIGAQTLDAGLTALAAFNTNGLLAQTATDTFAGRTLTGTANQITVTNGDGVSGNPTVSLPAAMTFTGKTVTGGTFTGITDIAVADGGTGASDAATARTNLGVVIGTDVQAQDAELQAIAGLTSAADRVPYFTGSGTAALATFTSFGRSLVDDADATAGRTTLGVDLAVVYQTKSGNYTGIGTDNNSIIRFSATATFSLTAAATLGSNWHVTIIADGGAVTVDPNGAETIDGASTIVIPSGSSTTIICNGSAFFSTRKKAPTRQIFTASGTYTAPAGLVSALVQCIGGGGGGGYARSGVGTASAGAGGGSGAYSVSTLSSTTIGASQTVTIGGGGAGGVGSVPTPATSGTSTSFGALVVAAGGAGGVGGTATAGVLIVDGGAGGLSSSGTGNITTSGQPGNPGITVSGSGGSSSSHSPGNGGNSIVCGGGQGIVESTGTSGSNGSGGGGAGGTGGGVRNGGAGGAGIIIVDEYYY